MKKLFFLLFVLPALISFSQQSIGTQFTTTDGLISNNVGKVFKDHAGNLWIGTQYGLTKKTGNQYISYSTNDGLPCNSIYAITEDDAGDLYIGTCSGAAKFDGTNFSTYDSLDNKKVTCILIDHNQNIWFGTSLHGIYVFDGNNWTHYQYGNEITLARVYALFEDSNNVIYAGGLGDYEINLYQGGTWTFLTTDTTQMGKEVYYFAQDSSEYIWASGHNSNGNFFMTFTGGNNFYFNYIICFDMNIII